MKGAFVFIAIILALFALTATASSLPIDEDTLSQPLLDRIRRSGCNPRECDQRCRRLKFPGGVCVNNRCKCDRF